ncbi:MAG: histidine kinase [Saprospiraceae bacterium]|nr:histidine kinase [Saprospiraceae bacterium]
METLQDIPVFRSELFDFTRLKRTKTSKGSLRSPEVILEEQRFKINQRRLTLTISLLWIMVQLITFLKNLFIYKVMGEQMIYHHQIIKRTIPLIAGIIFIALISRSTRYLFRSDWKFARFPLVHFGITAIVTAFIFSSLFFLVQVSGLDTFQNSNALKFFAMEVDRLFLIFLLASITTTAHFYFHKVRLKEIALLKMEKTYQHSEIISLNNELNPHMISNTLNNIYTLITTDMEEAKNMIVDFAHLLRQNLKNKDSIYTTLSHEKKFIKKYIGLLQNDQQKKYHVQFKYDHELDDAIIPKMILQPLVENAIKHCGFQDKEILKIVVHAEREDQDLKITVRNRFHKPDDGIAKDSAIGIGTENILKRLKVLYRNNFRFNLYENEKFFTCILKIPLSLDLSISPT